MEGVMVSAATGVMNSLLTKLAALLGEEYKLKKSVRRDIGFLKDELSSMNALLEKLADAEELDPQQKDWRNQVREMAYDIEDCIDDYMHRVQQDPNKSNGVKGFFREMIDKAKKLGACHGISEQIKELKIRIVQASERRDRYKLDAVPGSSSASVVPIDPRLPALYAEASSLVGIDGPRDELVKMVDDGEQQMKVVSIVGFGGLGKTTLANQIYKQVDSQFDCGAFVSMSQKPDVRKILRTILYQVKKQEDNGPQTWEENRLIQELREFLKDKRYFIIIDDIWTTQHWKIIKCALPENTRGSRISVTTRNLNVAKSCCSRLHDFVYKLRPLSEVDSTSLFFKRVFGSKDECPLKLKEVSYDIIRKCGGIPLAIITMASLLTNKTHAIEEWVIVLRSIGLGLEKNPHVEEMKKILSLSYNDLPHQLRSCLLYLGMFPEDYEVDRDMLIRRWIAEGFVKADGGRNLRENGESYFNELINRSMIQPVDIQYDGQADGCRVHDMILDFIMSKAVEENFITSVDDQSQRLVSQYKIRRLSLDFRGQENVGMMPPLDTSPVRSLGTFGYSVVMNRISDFLALRVLDIKNYELKCYDLTNIGNLIQLRYLRIHGYDVTDLPEQIGELQYLETLDIEYTFIKELPASITKLRRLKWLRCCISKLPDGLGNMQSLEELSVVRLCDNCSMTSLRELGSLSKLRTLELRWCISKKSDVVAYGEILALSLGKLVSSNIRQLSVSQWLGAYLPRDIPVIGMQLYSWSTPTHLLRELGLTCFVLPGIPEWMTSLSNLTELWITVNQVTQEMLDILGDLPALLDLFLALEAVAEPKERVVIPNTNFKCLKELGMKHWATAVTFEAGCMPKLETLTVRVRAREVQTTCYGTHYCSGVHHCSALRNVQIFIDCNGVREEEQEAVVDAIKDTASQIPNHPIPEIRRYT